ncbi:MAG: phosphate ABC transporter substrate-binding protein, partial [Gammaproteobacteria bacterium]|nr:phosphate ABC transporter substrate-binding protein [Gammaproteobacteria bacterium]
MNQFITCGMYAFTDPLRRAWQGLFDEFLKISGQEDIQSTLHFDSDLTSLRNPDLLIGHTCGYPLMHFLRDDLVPLCVPLFDLPGCDGKYYSSHIIVPARSNLYSLSDCKGLVAAINGHDSNSGMNVLRHAIALMEPDRPYFSAVHES